MSDDVYEEWVAHPNQRVFVHKEDHWSYSLRGGWWVTQRTFTAGGVQELGYTVEDRKTQTKLNERKA